MPTTVKLSLRAVLESREPDRCTSEVRKNKRGGRLCLDVSHNACAQLAAAPYSVQATADARVATLLNRVVRGYTALKPGRFALRTTAWCLAENDPWRTVLEPVSSPSPARRRVGALAA